jgi:hypothetical protein
MIFIIYYFLFNKVASKYQRKPKPELKLNPIKHPDHSLEVKKLTESN